MTIQNAPAQPAVQNYTTGDLPPPVPIIAAGASAESEPLRMTWARAAEWAGSRIGSLVLGALPALVLPHLACAGFISAGVIMNDGTPELARNLAIGVTAVAIPTAIGLGVYGLRRSWKACCLPNGEKFHVQLKKAGAMALVGFLAMSAFNTVSGNGLKAPEISPERLHEIKAEGGDVMQYYLQNCTNTIWGMFTPS